MIDHLKDKIKLKRIINKNNQFLFNIFIFFVLYFILYLKGPVSLMGRGAPLVAMGASISPVKTMGDKGTRHEESFPNSDKYKSYQIRSKIIQKKIRSFS